MDTWYYSPYPEPYNGLERLFLCEFCLKYFGKRTTLLRHAAKCALRHPPGDEIYRSPPAGPAAAAPAIAMFEVDGNRSKARPGGFSFMRLARAAATATGDGLGKRRAQGQCVVSQHSAQTFGTIQYWQFEGYQKLQCLHLL